MKRGIAKNILLNLKNTHMCNSIEKCERLYCKKYLIIEKHGLVEFSFFIHNCKENLLMYPEKNLDGYTKFQYSTYIMK